VDAAFPRRSRLTDAKDFKLAFAESRRIIEPALILLYRPNGLGFSRLGLAISKKHIKTAVGRNRAKRVIRDFFRNHREINKGLDIVLISRIPLVAASNDEIRKCLQRLWLKLEKKCAA
jgi:ribonuclease P protein component